MARTLFIIALTLLVSVPLTWLGCNAWNKRDGASFLSPLLEPAKPLPLKAFAIPTLAEKTYDGEPITISELLEETPTYTKYLFTINVLGKNMSGQLNIPTSLLNTTQPVPVIVMIRGYVPPETYTTGTGTKNAAARLAEAGYVTLAPDFFGYGESDPEPTDSWQARLEKPQIMAEIIASLKTHGVPLTLDAPERTPVTHLGMWGHSNGGQIALTTLEILHQSIPTTLWAPVTVPFPYSILFFTDENDDEGKAMRLWLSQFEQDYDVFDFSLTRHLGLLRGPIQLHHGTADEAALKVWSDEFKLKIDAENDLRAELAASAATQATAAAKIDFTFYSYPGANHNLQPGWETVVQRDIAFFDKHLKN